MNVFMILEIVDYLGRKHQFHPSMGESGVLCAQDAQIAATWKI